MPRYFLRDGRLVEKHLAPPLTPRGARSDLPRPMVISDHMDLLQSMANGRWYDSKAAMRGATRAAGCEEVGNDPCLTREHEYAEVTTDPAEEAQLFDRYVGS